MEGVSAQYASNMGAALPDRLLIVTSKDPAEGWQVYRQLEHYRVSPEFETAPTADYVCPSEQEGAHAQPSPCQQDPSNGSARPSGECSQVAENLPGHRGACLLPPAWDREFGTIDFLTLARSEVALVLGAQSLPGSADNVNLRAIRRRCGAGLALA